MPQEESAKPKGPKGIEAPLLMSTWPHLRTGETIPGIMKTVLFALAPAAAASVIFFGLNAVRVILLSSLFCLAFEALGVWIFHRKDGIRESLMDGSALVTGVLLAFNLPSSAPWWLIAVGAFMAMMIAKHVFGGLGQNPFNPALVARVVILASFPSFMTRWPVPFEGLTSLGDVTTAATPLGVLKLEGVAKAYEGFSHLGLFLGNVGGCLGETSVLALLIGGAFMLHRRVIRLWVPLTYIGTVFVLALVFWLVRPDSFADPLYHVLSGGLMLGAVFMATDMVTSPMTTRGLILFGIGCGIFTYLIRVAGGVAGYPEGVSFSILVMNGLTPLIDRYVRPRRYGLRKAIHG